ncbi:unnamed protein product [Polarella glacialis]|uniref:FAD/NAD(P)-binding domain-containing protein n=1 Tax=Polarella glacialis TaxID=89957 RepID=A0A813L6J4_POLGL|nr:unnamed protein product [Polarella glacialis]CAE8717884.1 unnamed protein product [Polarella glacialis]
MAKEIVIVGGGISGLMTGKLLVGKGHNVTILADVPYFEWPLAGSYSLAHPEQFNKAVSATEQHHVMGAKTIIGIAAGLEGNSLKLQDGTSLPFDALVAATGYRAGPVRPSLGQSLEERRAEVLAIGGGIKTAKTVIIGGGGPIGVELAGDIREANKDARIIIVVRGERALSYLNNKYTGKLMKQMSAMNIEIMANDTVDEKTWYAGEAKDFKLTSGQTIRAEVYIPAFTSGFDGGFTGLANERGLIPVNEFLQSTGKEKVFAVGCSDQEFAAVMKIEGQAKTVSKNVLALLSNKALAAHKDAFAEMTHPLTQKIGQHSYTWIEYEMMPPGPLLKCCGFPFCCTCCWPLALCGVGLCHPCAFGFCCGDPEGQGTAALTRMLLHGTGNTGIKGLGSAPKQLAM